MNTVQTPDGSAVAADTDRLIAYASAALGVPLRPETAVPDESGWDFFVLHVTDAHGRQWILRRPRRPSSVAQLATEAAVLDLVRDRVGVRTPHWHVNTTDLVAYSRLPGAPAGAEDQRDLVYKWAIDPLAATGQYLEPLARALVAVHTTPPELLHRLPSATPDGLRAEVAARLARAERELPLSAAGARRWHAWLDDDALWPDHLVLIHGDIHPGHTLVEDSPATGPRLTGLLDWANATVGDPAADFMDMYYAGGTPVLDRLLAAYRSSGGHVWPGMAAHIRARASFLWVHVALRGLDTDRPHLVETALARLQG
ncbi:macrolide 2'-phosphotransferase [Streptomyces sp. NPDC018045]|uniref:macrolide 2'-phosphotransferase n=1 Tax=Streptomyces sp. NPDC018045 TaxID=3365037 RepID=UPI0037A67B00